MASDASHASREPRGLSELLARYQRVTREALALAKAAPVIRERETAIELDMVSRYVADADFLAAKGDEARALAALSYAHGWLDCGARLGYFIVTDERLFTVDAAEMRALLERHRRGPSA